jgi:hypothetical protein
MSLASTTNAMSKLAIWRGTSQMEFWFRNSGRWLLSVNIGKTFKGGKLMFNFDNIYEVMVGLCSASDR